MESKNESARNESYLNAFRLGTQGNWGAAVDEVKPLADLGDAIATYLVAQFYLNTGDFEKGIPYAETAAKHHGNGWIASNYFGILWGQPERRQKAIEFMGLAIDGGIQMDPIAHAQQLASEGQGNLALQLIKMGSHSPPKGARAEWSSFLSEAENEREKLTRAVDGVERAQQHAIEAIQENERKVESERERLARVIKDTDTLLHRASAENLASEYGKHAESEYKRANRLTWAAGITAFFVAGAAVFFAFRTFSHETGVEAFATKAAVTVPLLIFAGYIAKLASTFREKAWEWRHVELQIRTAEPFISLLSEDRRELLLAALALRFFPGQGHGEAATRSSSGPDIETNQIVEELISRLSSAQRTPDQPSPAP